VPRQVKNAGDIETYWGIFLYLFSLLSTGLFWGHGIAFLFNILALMWIIMALYIYRGSRIARTFCLALGIIRIFTVLGAILSIFSIYFLYIPESSKKYFDSISNNSNVLES